MPLYHTIIIPHYRREDHLRVCLSSIELSAKTCGVSSLDYEVLVVGEAPSWCELFASVRPLPWQTHAAVELGPNEPAPYWKTKSLNAGIEAARGDVLSFIDADAVVGPRFMENVERLNDKTLTKLAYRVRYAGFKTNPHEWADHFEKYDTFALAFEAYVTAANDCSRDAGLSSGAVFGMPFGNSQFSILRDTLGDLRYDERYIGRGYDDIHFNRAIAERYGDKYQSEIVTDGPHAMFHVKHTQTPGFDADRWNRRNRRLYYQEPLTWFVCADPETAEAMQAEHPRARVTWGVNSRWETAEVIPGLDTVVHMEGVEL